MLFSEKKICFSIIIICKAKHVCLLTRRSKQVADTPLIILYLLRIFFMAVVTTNAVEPSTGGN